MHNTPIFKILFFAFATLVVVNTPGWGQVAYRHAADCWLEQNSGYAVSFTGTNPTVSELHDEIRRLSQLYKVPVEIIGAIAHHESDGLFHYGTVDGFVVHNIQECKYAYHNSIINSSGGSPPPGLGIMQLTSDTAIGTGNIPRLITDWKFNLEEGVKVLVGKFNIALTFDPPEMQKLERDNVFVLENWFFAVKFYNGSETFDYVNTIYGKIATLPLNGRLNGHSTPT